MWSGSGATASSAPAGQDGTEADPAYKGRQHFERRHNLKADPICVKVLSQLDRGLKMLIVISAIA